jgi:NAD+ synthase (glutamine-hydrolysing)
MAYSNKFGHIVLTTGNKSELSVGFSTLYGDTCGGLAVIADLWKNQVYELARTYNEHAVVIPTSTLEKPPSAELRPGQLDTDSLPPYERLDPILRGLVEDEESVRVVAERTGAEEDLVRAIQEKLHRSEYKRHQFPPALRVSRKAWVGRIYPILHKFRE